MRKLTVLLILAMLLGLLSGVASAEAADAVSSASVADFYADGAIAGDDLMNALNSFTGFYCVSTVNEDGTPQLGFYIYGCVKLEDKYYLQLGLAENQGRANITRTGEAVCMYAALPAEDATYPTAGARMWGKLVTDEALIAQLNPQAIPTAQYLEIVEVRPLG